MAAISPAVRVIWYSVSVGVSACVALRTVAPPTLRSRTMRLFPVLLDADKTVTKLYDMGAMPSTVLIDRDGRVRYLHRGYREGVEEAYERQIRELVKE